MYLRVRIRADAGHTYTCHSEKHFFLALKLEIGSDSDSVRELVGQSAWLANIALRGLCFT